jgi:hypothetical protein
MAVSTTEAMRFLRMNMPSGCSPWGMLPMPKCPSSGSGVT